MLGLPRWRRLERLAVGGLRWYYPAAVLCLLIAAAALRFYELGQPLAHHDEIVAALNSGGTLAEVVQNTRTDNSSPLLYPLILWAVQQVDISPFSIRLAPALSGVLTVGVILLLPRFGVRRDAALLAAILATLAPAAIYEARGAREYGVDALVAALLIAGLLWYRRNDRKALLCAALLVAPLLQYGLVLFGVAVIGAGLLLPPVSPQVVLASTARSPRDRILGWLRRRIGLAWPAAFFLAGCVISYLTTLRYQLETAGQGFVLSNYYRELHFIGEYQLVPVLEFAIVSVWGIAQHHLPTVVTLTVAGVLAIWLLSAGIRRLCRGRDDSVANTGDGGRHWNVVALLFALALTVAIGAAVLGQYPASPTRHITYLGPAVFVFSGFTLAAAIQWIAAATYRLTQYALAKKPERKRLALAIAVGPAVLRQYPAGESRQVTFLRPRVFVFNGGDALADATRWLMRHPPFTALARPRRLAPALTIVAAAIIICVSIVAIRQDSPYRVTKAADFFGFMEQSVHSDDIVYITGSTIPVMSFYGAYYGLQLPDNYYQGQYGCWVSYTICIREISNIVAEQESDVGDVWMIFHDNLSYKLERYDERGDLEFIADFSDAGSRLTTPSLALHRFPAAGGLLRSVRREWPEDNRAAKRRFEVSYNDGRLTYERESCAPSDIREQFFLHTLPAGERNVLPEQWQSYGFENRGDFAFADMGGTLVGNRCALSVTLPEYDLASIRTGQYDGDGRIWKTLIHFLDATQYAAAASANPVARSVFNLHHDGDHLLYAKNPCAPDNTADLFFLHITPADPDDLPEQWLRHGFEGRDFRFDDMGMYFDASCYVRVPLPNYEITRIYTGQYAGDNRIWEVEFALE